MSTMSGDSGAGAYSNMASVQGEIVGTGIPAGGHLLALHEQVVEDRRRAHPEPVRVEPVMSGGLVDQHQIFDSVLARPVHTRGLPSRLAAHATHEIALLLLPGQSTPTPVHIH